MKKFLLLCLLCAAMVLSFAACGKDEEEVGLQAAEVNGIMLSPSVDGQSYVVTGVANKTAT